MANPTAGALNVVYATPPVQNNLLIVAAMSSSFGSMTSTGWSSGPLTDDFDAMYMYYKIAGASESSTVSWTPSANDETALWIAEYSGNVTVRDQQAERKRDDDCDGHNGNPHAGG
jgi:hypothetical protein